MSFLNFFKRFMPVEKAPDGSPITEWDEYTFTPQPDITAFELALTMQKFASYGFYYLGMAGPIYMRKDGSSWKSFPAPYDVLMRRHFEIVKS